MATPFILRFQENSTDVETSNVSTVTQSQTFTRKEQADPDEEHSSYAALKHPDKNAGTQTKTATRIEHTDADRDFSPMGLIPSKSIPLSGTQTQTRIRAEGADEDPSGQQSRIIPSCFS
jgi:hypothetical protein